MELKHIAKKEGRLSSVLREEMALSVGLMNRLKWQDMLFVNGVAVHTDHRVQPGDMITVPLNEPTPAYPAEDGDLSVIYEDDYLLAVDKPAGMLIHPSRSRMTGTLANLVLGYYRKTSQQSAYHPITRLDRDTFGIVLLAKNAHIHHLLQEVPIEKTYEALVFGNPSEEEGQIDAPIERLPLPSLLRRVSSEGKPSLTRYRVLERKGQETRLALQPVTGRTHQLRVHCAHMGWPILGDPQYGSEASQGYSLERGISHQLLCAKSIKFPHPMTGKVLELFSQLNADE